VETDLLSENDNEPVVRSEQDRAFTMEELQQLEQQLDSDREDGCELVFESMNDMFPVLQQNGAQIRDNLDWDYEDQTADTITNNTTSADTI